MIYIEVDKFQAKMDALTLLNGDVDAAIEHDEPAIEEVYRKDHEDDEPCTLRLLVGGECVLCEVPPIENETAHDVANAIKRAGWHIVGLLHENAMLAASVGKDLAEQKLKLAVALHKLTCRYRLTLYHAKRSMLPQHNNPLMLQEVDELLKDCGYPPVG